MIETGVTRPLDDLGRVVIPKELREAMNITTGTKLIFSTTSMGIFLTPWFVSCTFCGSKNDLIEYKGKKICQNCINDFTKE